MTHRDTRDGSDRCPTCGADERSGCYCPPVDPRQRPGDHAYTAPRTGDPCVYCGQGPDGAPHVQEATR